MELIAAFDAQITAFSQSGDLDTVQELIAEKKAFIATKAAPTASAMRAVFERFQDSTSNSDSKLKLAYEAAEADYTKAGSFEDAAVVKQLLAERFPVVQPSEKTVTTQPIDPIADALETAKEEFQATFNQTHNEFVAVINQKSSNAADEGDLDGYKRFHDLATQMADQIFLPQNFKDVSVQEANATFVRKASSAFIKLKVAYQTAISDYTKSREIEEAETTKEENQQADTLEHTIHLLSGRTAQASQAPGGHTSLKDEYSSAEEILSAINSIDNHRATLSVNVQEVRNVSGDGRGTILVVGREFHVNKMAIWIWCYFQGEERGGLQTVKPGDTITVTGIIDQADFQGGKRALEIDLANSRLVP